MYIYFKGITMLLKGLLKTTDGCGEGEEEEKMCLKEMQQVGCLRVSIIFYWFTTWVTVSVVSVLDFESSANASNDRYIRRPFET